MRFVPLLSVLVFGLVALVGRAWLQRRRFGASGLVLFRDRRPLALLFDLGVVAAPLALLGDAIASAAGMTREPSRAATLAGAATVAIALGLMFVAQLQMGASWRVGIDPEARPGLVTSGVYAFSRNPIYACLFLAFAGFAALMPNAFTFALAALVVTGVHLQVRAEEAYLLATYGDAFRQYRARVGRYVV